MKTLEQPPKESNKLKKEIDPRGRKEEIKKYNFEEFERLEKSTISLVEQLKEKIDRGEYDMLISDDSSGRLHTLILRKVINERNRKMHPELPQNETEVKTRFIAGGTDIDDRYSKISEFFQKLRPEVKKKALLVTEYMNTGRSIRYLAELIEHSGIDFDIATDRAEDTPEGYKRKFPNTLGSKVVYVGMVGREFPLYKKPWLTGVEKKLFSSEAHPRAYRDNLDAPIQGSQEDVNKAREDVGILADKVLREVWGD